MNVEVEIVRFVRTVYLVQNVSSLESAERKALATARSGDLMEASGVLIESRGEMDWDVQWSIPVSSREDDAWPPTKR